MPETFPNLSNIRLGVPVLDETILYDGLSTPEMLADFHIIEAAKTLGAIIIKDESDCKDSSNEFYPDNSFYTLKPSSSAKNHSRLINELTEKIRQPERLPFIDFGSNEMPSLAFVLALSLGKGKANLGGGRHKYLIENDEQLDRFYNLCRDVPHMSIESQFEVLEYIPTPGEHYTSYRVLASPNGDILAAGLLYSSHTVSEDRRIETKNAEGKLSGIRPSYYWETLEDPSTPYFLDSLDIRSNVDQGGQCIPLMGGEDAKPINAQEKRILADHGIDPFTVDLPQGLKVKAKEVAKTVGRASGLVLGLDFLQHRDNGEYYFLEANGNPGAKTYSSCWLKGSKNQLPAYIEMYLKSLSEVAMGQE